MTKTRTFQLKRGQLTDLSRDLGRSPGHLSRVIAGHREASPELAAALESRLGVPLASVVLPGRGWRKGRKLSAQHRAAIAAGQRKRHATRQENR